MDKLQKLISLCKSGISVEINQHINVCQSVEQYLAQHLDWLVDGDLDDEIDPLVRQKMVELNTIVNLQFYPNTPVGFHQIYHYDLDIALDAALETFKLD